MTGAEPLAAITFEAEMIEWRAPEPYLLAPIAENQAGESRYAARVASHGWGVAPVTAARLTTLLFPRNGGSLLPAKVFGR